MQSLYATTCRYTVELVHVIARRLVLGTVDGHAVPDLIVIGNPPLLPYLPIW